MLAHSASKSSSSCSCDTVDDEDEEEAEETDVGTCRVACVDDADETPMPAPLLTTQPDGWPVLSAPVVPTLPVPHPLAPPAFAAFVALAPPNAVLVEPIRLLPVLLLLLPLLPALLLLLVAREAAATE